MHNPFIQDGYVIATDGTILIRLNKSLVNIELQEQDSPKCQGLFMPRKDVGFISLDSVKSLLSVPFIEETIEVDETKECTKCDGGGTVEWEFERWTKYLDCPVCYGEGFTESVFEKATGAMIKDANISLK